MICNCKSYVLHNGVDIPSVGFGTYKSSEEDDTEVIRNAIEAGYRHFDTASYYKNEHILGTAIKESGVPRSEFFIATKIWKDEMGYDQVFDAVKRSLKNLKTDYIDLLLIHWPKKSADDDNWRELDISTWKAMEELYESGKVKAIGVCNFMIHHLQNIIENGTISPMVNQIEFHPGYLQMEVVDYCINKDIQVEGWSPLGRARVLEHPLLLEIAGKYRVSTAQVCIRFALQEGVIPLPKTSSFHRMKENLDVFGFELSFQDMKAIHSMKECGWSGEHPDQERVYV